MNSKQSGEDKNLNNVEIDSPRFVEIPSKAGLYGKPQHQFINESKKSPIVNTHATITKAELMKHKSKASAWISLKGVVYDVTNYMKHHPGGDILLEGCGAESQKLFDEHHSWVNAKSILANCVVGHLETL